MKARYEGRSNLISSTIIARERIFPWERTRRSHERFNRQKWGRLWRCRKSVGCTTAMNDELPEKSGSIALRAGSPWAFELRTVSHARTSVNVGISFTTLAEPRAD